MPLSSPGPGFPECIAAAAHAGPGTTPDCGVTSGAPTGGGTITGKISWTATSGARTFRPIVVRGTEQVPVEEIQSLNG